MSPFYNKGPVPVVPYQPNPGSGTYPLDVTEAGGISQVQVSIPASAQTTILAAPAAGKAYRLQAFRVPAPSTQTSQWCMLRGHTSSFLFGQAGAASNGEGTNINGELIYGEAIDVQSTVPAAQQVYLLLDVIQIPHIQ